MSISYAWRVTVEDIMTVLENRGVKASESMAEDILDEIDTDRVVEAVLFETGFDEQVNAAQRELADILQEEGYI